MYFDIYNIIYISKTSPLHKYNKPSFPFISVPHFLKIALPLYFYPTLLYRS